MKPFNVLCDSVLSICLLMQLTQISRLQYIYIRTINFYNKLTATDIFELFQPGDHLIYLLQKQDEVKGPPIAYGVVVILNILLCKPHNRRTAHGSNCMPSFVHCDTCFLPIRMGFTTLTASHLSSLGNKI